MWILSYFVVSYVNYYQLISLKCILSSLYLFAWLTYHGGHLIEETHIFLSGETVDLKRFRGQRKAVDSSCIFRPMFRVPEVVEEYMNQCYDHLCALFLAWLTKLKTLGVIVTVVWDGKSHSQANSALKNAAWTMLTKPSTNSKATSNKLMTAIVVILSIYICNVMSFVFHVYSFGNFLKK